MEIIDEKKKTFIVYLRILHGKEYVGQTSGYGYVTMDDLLKDRSGNNGSGYKSATRFYKAIEKYGWDKVTSKVLYCGLNQNQADMLETYEIIKRKTTDPKFGYNMTRGNGYMVDSELMEELLSTDDKNEIKLLLEDIDDTPKFINTHDAYCDFVQECKDNKIQGRKHILECAEKYGLVESSFTHYTNKISGGRRYDPEFHELWATKERDCEGDVIPLF